MASIKKIVMRFKKEGGGYYTVKIEDAKKDVKRLEIKDLMDKILEKEFIKGENLKLVGIKDASFIETEKSTYKLEDLLDE